jgi:hypothetical protein
MGKEIKVLSFIHDDFEDLELWYPVLRLMEEGITVHLAGEESNKKYIGKYGVPAVSTFSLEEVEFLAVVVKYPGDGGAETGLMHSALRRVDVVCKGQYDLVVAVVVLHCDLSGGIALLPADIDDLIVQRGLVVVYILDEGTDAALVMEIASDLFLAPAVGKRDAQTRV